MPSEAGKDEEPAPKVKKAKKEKKETEEGAAAADVEEKPSKDRFKVYVGGLPFNCDRWEIKDHFFRNAGEVDWLHMPLDEQERPRGIAFISFWTQKSFDKALLLNGTTFKNRQLTVNMAGAKPQKAAGKAGDPSGEQAKPGKDKKLKAADKGSPKDASVEKAEELEAAHQDLPKESKDRKVFVGGIPFSCSKKTLKADFEVCGAIQQLSMPRDGQRSKGIAFITFSTKEAVAEALKFHDTEYGGCKLTVRMASDRREKGNLKGVPVSEMADKAKTGEQAANPLEVIVKGLNFKTKEESVKEFFALCGDIESLRMPLNKKGKCCGFAFVAFADNKGVKKALKLSGTELSGRPVTVERMGEAPQKSSKDGTEEAKKRAAGDDEDVATAEVPKKKKKKTNQDVDAEE